MYRKYVQELFIAKAKLHFIELQTEPTTKFIITLNVCIMENSYLSSIRDNLLSTFATVIVTL